MHTGLDIAVILGAFISAKHCYQGVMQLVTAHMVEIEPIEAHLKGT